MPFSSFTGGGGRRGGWGSSILPFSAVSPNAKSKHNRKFRRRLAVRDFIFANFFTIGILISFFFFFIVLLRYGVPKPIASPFKSHANRSHRPRKPIVIENRNSEVLSSNVDITTKELYDQIEFLDVDGGPWKQGWRVAYEGDEWDSEKLKVLVVPHSHNDPGWLLTVDEYYEKQTRHILDTIVEALSQDSRRKFIWEEMSYLEKWWRDASDEKRESFVTLVKNGQLEIVGGGWVMNDEANSHYFSIIEQMAEGNMWLNETIGVVPKNSWAIDPFGYSPTMAYLLRRMGFENMLIQRTHYELKKELALHKNLEFAWRQSWDAEETTDIFVHMMPFYSYDIPHTCGPEPAICCQFDFARSRGSFYELCPWRQDPVEINKENVQERAMMLLDQYRKKSVLFRTNTLLIPLGDDFRYVSTAEAEVQFKNYQLLFDYINSNPSLNAEVKFGTLEDYFRTLRDESEKINYSLPGEIGSSLVGGFPSLSGDFFTYADRQQDYWSGYYVSRPFFKAVDRVLERTLRAAEMILALLLGPCQRSQCEKLPIGFSYKLTAARRNLALFQHHDGVTGTAKDHVVRDYGVRMHTSLQDLHIFMSKGMEVLLGIRHDKSDQNPSQFEPEQMRSKYDSQPIHKSINLQEGTYQSVVFFNPLEQTREEVAIIIVNRTDITVLDSNWTCLQSQISPEFQHDKAKPFTGSHRIHWKISVPALGLQTYYIANGLFDCEKPKPAKLKFSSTSTSLPCPTPYVCSMAEGDVVEIQNQHHSLVFDIKHGLLHKISKDGSRSVVNEEIAVYSSWGSGAYLFKPTGAAKSIIEAGGLTVIIEGPLMQEVYSHPKTGWKKSPISHSTRLYSGGNINQEHLVEMEYHVELIGKEFDDRELIVRYKTDIDNNRVFYSDLNGFQMSRRESYDKIPLQGNYYPMPSLAFMQGSNGQRFSVHSRQSLGVASLGDGWLEIMLDRRVLRDDGRGLGQGITDNRAMNVVFHILVESNVSSIVNPIPNYSPLSPSLLSHCIGARLNYPLHAFISKKPQSSSVHPPPRSFSPLAAPLPCDLHIVSFKVPRPLKYSQQSPKDPPFLLMFHRRHWDSSYCKTARSNCTRFADEPFNIFNTFKGLVVSNARPTSLNLLHEDTEMLGYNDEQQPGGDDAHEGQLHIPPMEVRAYKLELTPR
ncbi:alpha-mannosidase 2-like [Cucurbita pepo subsp. pepo]|uniref:alpha-mannosidase 2-like n=1 Tax=Cucurbita pepo subsp. pepo TaxID=3664 RepID=UPI000C9D290C|nr:alpha-mannosidase 2-like [Cucurbita pepo subsp. pepo]